MNRLVIRVLRALIVITALIALYGQVIVIPTSASDMAEEYPDLAYLAVPYAILAIIGVACVEAALVAVWKLLSMARKDAIFGERAFLWVDVIIGAASVATLIAAGVAVHLWVIPTISITAMVMFGLVMQASAAAFAGFAFVLLMLVMRGLLRKATRLRSELAEVI
ncbi:MAG TPA: DUF2975 domain-containing protein [Pseudonocardiaceae bacterium]